MPTTRSKRRAEPNPDASAPLDSDLQPKATPSAADKANDNVPAPKRARRAPKKTAKDQPDGNHVAMLDSTANNVQNGKSRSDDENVPETTTTSVAQITKVSDLKIPLDEYCPLHDYTVHIDSDDGTIYDAALNQTNSGDNANKFYRIQLLSNGQGNYQTWTRWGRVGESGQNATLGNGKLEDARTIFSKKFKDKTGLKWDDRSQNAKPGKYVFIERNYEPDSDEKEDGPSPSEVDSVLPKSTPACTLSAPVKSLMELIFNAEYMRSTMADLNYDANKLPLGKLSQATMTRGYEALKSLSEIINDPSRATSLGDGTTFQSEAERLSNLYYSYIPHAFGRQRPPVILDQARLRKEIELLDSLSDMKVADSLLKATRSSMDDIHILDANFKSLGLNEMTPLQKQTDEFDMITAYLHESRGATHGFSYDVVDIFRIERNGETDRFKAFNVNKSDRRLLWHGSRSTNFGGILSQGLRIAPPEAPVNGYMFGKGLYLADMSSKSAGYCCSHISDGHALLLLCEAELGDPMLERTHASGNAGQEALQQGSYSTWGRGSTGPSLWKDAGCIHSSLKGVRMPDTSTLPGDTNVPGATLYYNEYICYDVAQVRLRYLLRVKI